MEKLESVENTGFYYDFLNFLSFQKVTSKKVHQCQIQDKFTNFWGEWEKGIVDYFFYASPV